MTEKKIITRILLAFILVSIGLFLYGSVFKLPAHTRLFFGEEHFLRVLPGFTVRDPKGSNVLTPTEEGLSIKPAVLGKVDLELRFLDVIPLKQLVVAVVPKLHVRPGGQAIGILLSEKGLVVTRTLPVMDVNGRECNPAGDAGIMPGDIIEAVGGHSVQSLAQIAALVNNIGTLGQDIILTVKRGGSRFQTRLTPIPTRPMSGEGYQARYMLGMILEEPTAGVGTLTFYHGQSGSYGALGHLIATHMPGPAHLEDGRIVKARISEVRKGSRGSPGEKKGVFQSEKDTMGTIEKNTKFGVFGRLYTNPPNSPWDFEVPVALASEVRVGPAEILTVLAGDEVEAFDVEILKVTPQNKADDKGMIVRIVDERLLARTGGIIQGMSGSPILQNGSLVGAVTHVFVNDPQRGYGVFAEWMLQEAGLWDGFGFAPGKSA